MTKINLVKLLQSSLAEKDLGFLIDTKLAKSQQGTVASKVASCPVGCTKQIIASSKREVTLSLCSVLHPGLGSLLKEK